MFTQTDLNCISIHLNYSNKVPEKLEFARVESPFGTIVLVARPEGICYLGFEMTMNKEIVLREVAKIWPHIILVENEDIIGLLHPSDGIYRLCLKGTPFQMQVWEALVQIQSGQTVSYSELARRMKKPSATRAVASAVAANPVSLLIPCHRVVCKGGDLGNYHWGKERKKLILRSETDSPVVETGRICF
ncbi:MAG: methylated-DNA--[protein]-cysteine S-methyltransferase [Bacteroidales bacterium]